jgi:type IV pilus biogenesis protein CpaD/CtpE
MTMDRSERLVPVVMPLLAVLLLAGCASRAGVQTAPTARFPCPPWVEFPADIHSNDESPYLGCVNAVNLIKSAENPQDLVHGRTLAPAEGERESRAVDAYQARVKSQSGSQSGGAAFVLPPMGGGTP